VLAARAELAKLAAVEKDLRDRLSGTETRDSVTGLMKPAEV
jgi:hypothetical protein